MVDPAFELAWETELFSLQLFESPKGDRHRAAVVTWLDGLLGGVSALIGAEQGMPVAETAAAGTKVIPFGSYREGVHGPQSDLDLLAICPAHVSRDAFFAIVPALLLACAREGSGGFAPSFVQALPDAFVPVVKFGVGGLQVDLLFARLPLPRLPPALLSATIRSCSPGPPAHSAVQGAGVSGAPSTGAPSAASGGPSRGSGGGSGAPQSPSSLLAVLDDSLAKRLAADDSKSGLSLNGVRVTERIMASLTSADDQRAFQVC